MTTIVLRIKDVLHFAPSDICPLDPISPFVIPPQSPNPLILTFTSQQFRDFWYQERRAYDWQYRTAHHSKFYRQEDLDTPLPNKSSCHATYESHPGRRPEFDWSLQYICRRWHKPNEKMNGHVSVGMSCKASLSVRKIIGKDNIQVLYHWEHSHDTSSAERARLPCGRSDREWLQHQIDQGHDWNSIRRKLRPGEELAQAVSPLCTFVFIPWKCPILIVPFKFIFIGTKW